MKAFLKSSTRILLLLVSILFLSCNSNDQTKSNNQTNSTDPDIEAITATLTDYIEGTANGIPERVTKAFHPDLNLYSVAGDSVKIWYGKDYIGGIKPGRKSNRVGEIISTFAMAALFS